jgi:ribosomal-protein-alanine N-acetyltransferase
MLLNGELLTARLRLCVLRPEQAALLQAYLLNNRQHLSPWEPLRHQTYFELEQCQNRIAHDRLSLEAGNALALSLLHRETGVMLGCCNFSNIVRGVFMACHLGYAIDHAHEGRGYMREALQEGIRHMFEEIGLHRIMANHLPYNLRSASLLHSLGFEKEGYAKSYLQINGRWQDHVLTSLLNPAQI